MKYGSVTIKIEAVMIDRGLSKNKLCHYAELERKQLNALCRNEATRIDLGVLARICSALECGVSDILEFVPESNSR